MSYLLDTNVLLRSVQLHHPMHLAAKNAVTKLLAAKEEVCLMPQNFVEFWAVATRPVAYNGLGLTIAEAKQETARLKAMFAFKPDVPAIFAFWEYLVEQYQVSGKPTHDARLVAAMQAHGVSHLLTFNTGDFKRYAGIIAVVAPADVV